MLAKEDNELLSRVGPGTPMGHLLRQYWIPASSPASSVADGSPVRVRLIGENLIAFRDTSGRVGMIPNHCPHRGASLFFGRNEEAGIRCVYHGWKFDCEGECVDMPNEPEETRSSRRSARAPIHASRQRHRVDVHGPAAALPPLPDLEPNLLPTEEVVVQKALRECTCIYRQTRVGEAGRRFTIYKLRSMGVTAERPGSRCSPSRTTRASPASGASCASRTSTSCPSSGTSSRRHVEVGPRPERPEFVTMLEDEVPYWSRRLLMKPGVTGWTRSAAATRRTGSARRKSSPTTSGTCATTTSRSSSPSASGRCCWPWRS